MNVSQGKSNRRVSFPFARSKMKVINLKQTMQSFISGVLVYLRVVDCASASRLRGEEIGRTAAQMSSLVTDIFAARFDSACIMRSEGTGPRGKYCTQH